MRPIVAPLIWKTTVQGYYGKCSRGLVSWDSGANGSSFRLCTAGLADKNSTIFTGGKKNTLLYT